MATQYEPLCFSCEETAQLAHISPSLVRKMLHAGQLRGARVGRLWRIPKGEV